MRRLLAALLLVSVAASCDTFDPLIENTVTGTWRGESSGQTFLVVMQQSGTTVAGTGTITSTAAGTRNLSVSGTFNQPNFSGTLTPNGAAAISLVATVEGRSLVGTLTGGGFNGAGLALTRD
jgi:hypothetical protein